MKRALFFQNKKLLILIGIWLLFFLVKYQLSSFNLDKSSLVKHTGIVNNVVCINNNKTHAGRFYIEYEEKSEEEFIPFSRQMAECNDEFKSQVINKKIVLLKQENLVVEASADDIVLVDFEATQKQLKTGLSPLTFIFIVSVLFSIIVFINSIP